MYGGCGGKYEPIKESRIALGTVIEITVAHEDRKIARAAMEKAFDEFERVERQLSGYLADSGITSLNESGGRQVALGDEIFGLLLRSKEISVLSRGAFDVTVGPLMALWRFDEGGRVPSDEELRSAVAAVGFGKLEFDGGRRSVRLTREGMKVDLGGIGKGYAVDRAAEVLRAAGITDAIIDAGGDLRLLGRRPGKDFWRIGIRHPRDPARLLVDLDLAETAIVTSGDYERFFMQDDVRYHHILDPATGRPVESCQSVTVIAPTALEADAYATAAFVMGPAKGIAFLRALPGVDGIIVDAAGELLWTDETRLKR
jgi:thiamine biosynthesis lipoprotein